MRVALKASSSRIVLCLPRSVKTRTHGGIQASRARPKLAGPEDSYKTFYASQNNALSLGTRLHFITAQGQSFSPQIHQNAGRLNGALTNSNSNLGN